MAAKQQISKIYKELLKESSNFNSYYYRNYFTRKIESQFKDHMSADEGKSKDLLMKSEKMLAMLKRQTMISNAYDESRLVIERLNEPSKEEDTTTRENPSS